VTATFYPEDVAAIDRALRALHAEQSLLGSWHAHSTELQTQIDQLDSFRERLLAEQTAVRDSIVAHRVYPTLKAVS
jgi:hypothetical protein